MKRLRGRVSINEVLIKSAGPLDEARKREFRTISFK